MLDTLKTIAILILLGVILIYLPPSSSSDKDITTPDITLTTVK